MLAADIGQALALRSVYLLARKLSGFEPGILADENACGTAAPAGEVPVWGQSGTSRSHRRHARLYRDGRHVRYRREVHAVAGVSAHAIEWDKPFLSETGYRSFLGLFGVLGRTKRPSPSRAVPLQCMSPGN
jgi:hypothetical protein